MEERDTQLGTMFVGSREEIFAATVKLLEDVAAGGQAVPVGLTGGSTPKAFYSWAVTEKALNEQVRANVVWSVSDERLVPLSSEESNFGNAERQLLDPLEVPSNRRFPWPVQVDPHSGADLFTRNWVERFGAHRGFDLCFLGMGDDNHTASLFPGSPIIGAGISDSFACVEVPEKGWRFTITPSGLARCRKIAVMITGEAKQEPLQKAIASAIDTASMPIQLLAEIKDRVVILADEAAAG